jgi:proline iminopeptidase
MEIWNETENIVYFRDRCDPVTVRRSLWVLVDDSTAVVHTRYGPRGAESARPAYTPAQTGDPDYWQVEDDIKLYHFAEGTGRNVLIVHGGPGMPFREPLAGLASLTGDYRFIYYDQRGCGKSSRPINKFTSQNMYENMTTLDKTLGLGAQIADIERIRQILGEEKLILIGHSWAGSCLTLRGGIS